MEPQGIDPPSAYDGFEGDQIWTPLELFLRSRHIRPAHLAVEANISRQQLLRVRKGRADLAGRRMGRILSALRRMTLEPVRAEDVFVLTAEEGGWRLLADVRERVLRSATLHHADIRLARSRIKNLRRHPIEAWPSHLRKLPGAEVAVLRELLRLASASLDTDASRAVRIYEAAAALVEGFAVAPEIRAYVRGTAFLYRAFALRQQGSYSDALRLLAAAEETVDGSPFCATLLAQVWYECAALFSRRCELPQAERWARRAIVLFTVLGDRRRVAKAQIIVGGVAFERGELATALELFSAAIGPLRIVEDTAAVASLMLNTGTVETRLGRASEAKGHLDAALRMFRKLGLATEVLRTRWSIARWRLLYERRAEGLSDLRAIRAEYLLANVPGDAAFVGLDLVEALLDADAGSEEAAALCRRIVAEFEVAGVPRKVLETLSRLREAVRQRSATADFVAEVRASISAAAREAAAVNCGAAT